MDDKYDFTFPGVVSLSEAQGFRQLILHIFTRDADVVELSFF